MLGGPPPPRLGAVVIAPDDLVQERLASEQLVEQQLAVVGLAVVDVEIERAVWREQLTRACDPGSEERQVVGERILVAQGVEQLAEGGRLVAPVGSCEQRLILIERGGVQLTHTAMEAVRFVPLVRNSLEG